MTQKNKKGDRDSFHRVASGDVGVARWAVVIVVVLTKLTGLALHKTGCTLMLFCNKNNLGRQLQYVMPEWEQGQWEPS